MASKQLKTPNLDRKWVSNWHVKQAVCLNIFTLTFIVRTCNHQNEMVFADTLETVLFPIFYKQTCNICVLVYSCKLLYFFFSFTVVYHVNFDKSILITGKQTLFPDRLTKLYTLSPEIGVISNQSVGCFFTVHDASDGPGIIICVQIRKLYYQ